MRGAQGAVALIAAVVLTACTNETQAAGPTSSSSSSSTTATTTTTKSVAEMLPRHVEEAAIPRHGMIDRGSSNLVHRHSRTRSGGTGRSTVPPGSVSSGVSPSERTAGSVRRSGAEWRYWREVRSGDEGVGQW